MSDRKTLVRRSATRSAIVCTHGDDSVALWSQTTHGRAETIHARKHGAPDLDDNQKRLIGEWVDQWATAGEDKERKRI